MKPPLEHRFIPEIKSLDYYEINLPTYLQTSLDQWKYDTRDNLKDCFFEDLYSSINIAEARKEVEEHNKTSHCSSSISHKRHHI